MNYVLKVYTLESQKGNYEIKIVEFLSFLSLSVNVKSQKHNIRQVANAVDGICKLHIQYF